MKLTGRDAAAYTRKPDPGKAGVLLFGADAMRVALRRQELVANLVGPDGEAEMRLDRLQGADVRKDPAALADAVRAQGFFPGARVVLVEEAGDGIADAMQAALGDWAAGDAQIVVTAGALAARSKLRKLFETRADTVAIGIYDDPPTREEIESTLKEAGLTAVSTDAMDGLFGLSRALDPGDFRQTVERIALYKLKDDAPLSAEEVDLLAPASIEAEVDDLLHAVAERQARRIGPILARLKDQGVTPVSLSIAATRHFRTLHAAASDPGGPASGLSRVRPPVFGPRRTRMENQVRMWDLNRLESALKLLIDTDLTLRSAAPVPDMSLVERTLLRLALDRSA